MTRPLTFLILASLLCACNLPLASETASPLQSTVHAVSVLKAGLQIPQHFLAENAPRTGDEFDPNLYFTALTHLSMQPGYTLDYVYKYDGAGAYPVLYARPQDSPPYLTYAEFAASPQAAASFLDYVQADGTPESYFEFVALQIMAPQFYLYWHAGYNDTQIVCDRQALETILENLGTVGNRMPLLDQLRARRLDLEPVIEIGAETVRVQIVTFSLWGGFFRETYTLQRQFPHTILDVGAEELLPYDCGIMF